MEQTDLEKSKHVVSLLTTGTQSYAHLSAHNHFIKKMEMEVDQDFDFPKKSEDKNFSFPSSLSRYVSKSEDVRYAKIFEDEKGKKWTKSDIKQWLNGLAYFMLNEASSLSDEFLNIIKPIVTELLSCATQVSLPPEEKHIHICYLLARLAKSSKGAANFSLEYFKDHQAPFIENSTSEPLNKKCKRNPKSRSKDELSIVVSCYSFLSTAPEFFRNIWRWSPFVARFICHRDSEVRWVTYQCLRYLLDMDEQNVNALVKLSISLEDHQKYTFKYQYQAQERKKSLTLSIKPLDVTALEGVLSSSVVDVEGILLPQFMNVKGDFNKDNVVTVESTKAHLRNIALAISSSLPVLVSGPIGCGKTTLIEHIAGLTGRTAANQGLLKIQLGDQTDAKVLVGTYHSTDTPGEFIWAPGILTQAIREGKWLLLEDIDHAPMDVITMLLPLVESSSLYVPGHGDVITASPGFQLFATQRTLDDAPTAGSNTIAMTRNLWRHIAVEPFTRSEFQYIINARYPNLRMIVEKTLDIYEMLQDDQSTNRSKNIDRRLSSRDFLKWCKRISISVRAESTSLISSEDKMRMFQDAIDCFVGCFLDEEKRLQLAELLCVRLGLRTEKTDFYCKIYKPTLNLNDDTASIGRIALTRSKVLTDNTSTYPYSWTRSSSVLLERLAACVQQLESVLLVGETGTGKTSTIQYLAQLLGRQLIVINLNQQSDSADLLGGYKPIDLKWKISPIRQQFESLFSKTFNVQQNAEFLFNIAKCFTNRHWNKLVLLMIRSQQSALSKCPAELKPAWEQLGYNLQQLRILIRHADNALAFSFIEGSLVKAIKEGHWVLLDEINLATAETLECLSSVLENDQGSVLLFERGDREPINRHPEFRLFAAMNPATDVGKKQLPLGLRSRFTEFVVDDINTPQDLATLVGDYLRDLNLSAAQIEGIVNFYTEVRGEALRSLTDGTGRQPHYSLRTLCRALVIASSNPCGSVARSLYEAFCLSFLTQLDRSSHPIVEKLVLRHIIGKKNLKSILSQDLAPPPSLKGIKSSKSIKVEGYWIPKGDLQPSEPESYILTDSVRLNLKDLVRVVSLGRLPVLLQGETSVGKTSLIGYLAQLTGNKCVRVNNHEHTDLQEYIGSYTADPGTGKLVFREGVLVDAMRNGYWLILDELNLAPSEVLEALNRLLDDNRELFITETQETIKAHPRFLLFATQNPPGGMYGGRKLLSRAFRNRFVELHFDEIPTQELEFILHKRCAMPLSYCKRCVAVMVELQLRRRGSAAFAGKRGFMTLRDLFRWAERYRLANNDESRSFYDWDQHLADEGFLVLAGRVRKEEEVLIICDVLAKHFKRRVEPNKLFTLSKETSPVTRPILESLKPLPGFEHLVWTYALRRLAVLVGQAMKFCEPVLLVGDTGCGKTTVCQYLAALRDCQLMTVNCHQYSEGSDFLGGLRPVRTHSDQSFEEASKDKLFEWVDGPLVLSMIGGHYFLADEISLADDSVLERLNSVLEPERSLLLSEKATSGDPEVIKAAERFRFLSTMNPGGDYGKKELSPALRNRLTEIWCPLSRDRKDIVEIVDHNLKHKAMQSSEGRKLSIAECMVDFLDWFSISDCGRKSTVSIRDIMAWVQFINTVQLEAAAAYIHGACLVFLDSIGDRSLIDEAIITLIVPLGCNVDVDVLMGRTGSGSGASIRADGRFGLEPFYIETGPKAKMPSSFTFQAPSTSSNLLRLLRGLQVNKPLLLEGSPGVGKTSLVAALAAASGHELIRINLSEQTDVSDLFGADLPVEDSDRGGHFEWRDGPLLRALKEGQWVVLDELNLASQSVLEGLNAVLDHRGELYIPELGRSFQIRRQKTRLFACQNPLKQGGARKGLPKSFLNRFTQVYVEPLSTVDLNFIACSVYPQIDSSIITKMVNFNERLIKEIMEQGCWGTRGGPWEFNLRDVFRWCEAVLSQKVPNPGQFVNLIYANRMRTIIDRNRMLRTYEDVFGPDFPLPAHDHPHMYVSENWIQVGDAIIPRGHHERDASSGLSSSSVDNNLLVLQRDSRLLESLFYCVKSNWMTIVVGPKGSGKTSLIRLAAQLTGNPLDVLNINSAMDTTELLGGFEQADPNRTIEDVAVKIDHLTRQAVRNYLPNSDNHAVAMRLLEAWDHYKNISAENQNVIRTTVDEAQYLEQRAQVLLDVLELLDSSCPPSKIENLRSKITKVINQSRLAAKSGSTSGGTFEWVDSLLVKALQEGRWLLMDNVNLCSASVLDRLNGLLEPNGTLTLSERGVIDGQIPEVQPHPEFRLFLALDPRYGEISRAMRNRGVELFIHGSDEVGYPETDLISIMHSAGLRSDSLQRTLLKFHQWLCSEPIPAPERPTLNELVQASSLTSQRLAMLHSLDPLACLEEICKEIYIRNVRSPVIQEQAREKFTEIANSDEILKISTMLGPAMSGKEVEQSAILARNQQACLVAEKAKEDFEDLKNAILLLFLTASHEDVDWRLQFLNNLANNEPGFQTKLRDVLVKLVEPNNLPWDMRWFQNISKQHLGLDISDENQLTGSCNRVSLALYWNAWNQPLPTAIRNSRTVHSLALALNSGALAEEAVPDKLLVILPRFLLQLDNRIELLINSPNVYLTNKEWQEMITAFIMRFHMSELDGLSVENDKLEASLSCIGQYWEWLCKWTLPVVTRLLKQFNLSPLQVPDVNSNHGRIGALVSRRLRRLLEIKSEPFQDELQAERSRLISTVLSLCIQPALFSTPRGIQLVQSLPELFISGDLEKLAEVEREMRKFATESAPLNVNRLLIFALLDHLVALCHYHFMNSQPEILTALTPTASGVLLKAGRLPAIDSYLAHWEVVTRLSWTHHHSPSWLSVSPVFSLVALNYHENNSHITLGQSQEQFAQYGFLKEILWNSTKWLQSKEYDPTANDHRLALDSADCLISGVNQALGVNNDRDLESWGDRGVHSDAIRALRMAVQLREDPQKLGSFWLLQGLARCLLLVPHDPVDPVEKRILKKKIRSHDKERIERFVRVLRIHHELIVGGELVAKSQHPHAQFMLELIEHLSAKSTEDLQQKPAWRPRASLFLQYVKDVRHYVNSVGSPSSVFALQSKLNSDGLEVSSIVSEAELWLTAQRTFYQTLKEKYFEYPDLIVPFMAGMAQMMHGVQLLIRNLKANAEKRRLNSESTDLSDAIANLFDLPSGVAAKKPAGLVKLAELSTSTEMVQLLRNVIEDPIERRISEKNLLLSALKDLERYCRNSRGIDVHAWNTSLYVLDTLVSAWITNSEKIKQRQLESESMYKTRTIHHEGEASDAEKEARAVSEYFPSYENDYNDDKANSMQTDAVDTENENDLGIPLNSDDEDFICRFHTNLLLTWGRSLRLTNKRVTRPVDESVKDGGFYLRYPLLKHVLSRVEPNLSTQFDRRLIGAHLIYLQHSLEKCRSVTDCHSSAAKFNFYYDACPDEAVTCRPILSHLKERVLELLAQWPGHAVLEDIFKLIDRILTFSLTSPLMKLVTGLEMLLTKCHEWETNAHKGVSIMEDIQNISKLVLKWRTLELDCWKQCLNKEEERAASETTKYWFHLYSTLSLATKQSKEEEADHLNDVQTTLRKFMESSSLGQFEARLEMLRAFAYHVALSNQQSQLLALLWHVLMFYDQFAPLIAKKKAGLRQPIEKKVKDFIKIMRWNDINYYALKEAVKKAHVSLHKFIREWREVLEQPVRSMLSEPPIDVERDEKSSIALQPPMAVIKETGTVPDFDVSSPDYSVISRLPRVLNRSLKICEQTLASCPLVRRIEAVDDLVGTVIQTVDELQKLKVIGKGEEKEKQKNEAKSISMRKRKSLFELFRILQKVGLSYRKGAFMWNKDTRLSVLEQTLPILEVDGYLDNAPTQSTHEAIRRVWDKGPFYYTRCLARLAILEKKLEKPSSDLGPNVIERIKGYATHFMAVIQDQWKDCSTTLEGLVRLRTLVTQFSGYLSTSNQTLPPSSVVIFSLEHLRQVSIDALGTLDDFAVLLKAYPTGDELSYARNLDMEDALPLSISRDLIADLLNHRSVIVNKLCDMLLHIERNFRSFDLLSSSCSGWLFGVDQWNCIVNGYNVLHEAQESLRQMISIVQYHSFSEPLAMLDRRFASCLQTFRENNTTPNMQTALLPEDEKLINEVGEAVLCAFQKIYKKYHEPTKEESKNGDNGDEDEEDNVLDLHLTEKLMRETESDIKSNVRLEPVIESLQGLLTSSLSNERKAQLVAYCSPLLEQYASVAEYFFWAQLATLRTSSKLLSVLLNIFNQLIEKGYCLPTELEDSKESDSKGDFQDIESGGLGDGEGMNDVSDQIENEDQLESAHQQGQKDENCEEDQPQPKEEENGIEMSEDFGGDLQDMEKDEKEGDDSGSESEEEGDDELDKQMDKVGDENDKLDEKLWGSDEEEETQDQEQDEGPGDGKTSEQEITAKQNEEEEEGDDDNADEGRDKKKEPKLPEDENAEYDEDQVDPYHKDQEPDAEPEPMDVPEDLNLDNAEAKDNGEEDQQGEENPFDIDEIKQDMPLDENDQNKDGESESEDTPQDDETEKNGDADAASTTSENNQENPESMEVDQKEDDPKEEGAPDQAHQEEATPSATETVQPEAQPSNDTVKGEQKQAAANDQSDVTPPEDNVGSNQEADDEDKQGVGMAESKQMEGHEGREQTRANNSKFDENQKQNAKEKSGDPRKSDPNRALADALKERVLQAQITETLPESNEDGANDDDDGTDQSDLYRHIKNVDKASGSSLAKDAATEEQAKEQLSMHQEMDEKEQKDLEENEEMVNQLKEEEPMESDDIEKMTSETVNQSKKCRKKGEQDGQDGGQADSKVEVEGEVALTTTVKRGPEGNYVTQHDIALAQDTPVSMETIEQLRHSLQERLSTWSSQPFDTTEGQEAWRNLEMVTSDLAKDLCEQLRLILEPSLASRLKGDYRTGKRLNMRKVIPYIASHFRKDRIWLRRTKPAQRNYQIVLAVDDSSSMADNKSKELAFESVALISKALCLLEAGQLGIVSFGEQVQLLHPLQEQFSDYTGPRILQQFTFEQRKTRVHDLVDFVTAMMCEARSMNSAVSGSTAQLLLIVSDGRGLFNEGQDCVMQAIRRAKQAGLFMVFVIIDNVQGKDSILDIRVPVFENGKLLSIKPYLDSFPFPFYVILRDIQTLPVVLSDALRQWFELVVTTSNA